MAIDNTGLVYLFDSIFQIENLAGRPVCPGHIEVFVAGTDTKYITYQNFDGTRNPFKVPLNSDGRAVILVEAQFKYDVYIYDSFNNMICSRLNVAPAVGGDVNVSGLTEVYHDGTLEGEGTPWVPLTVSTSAIDEMVSGKADVSALTAYQEISGMTAYQPAGDYYSASNPSGFATTAYVDSGLSGKADTSALDGLMSASLLESTDGVITAYNGSAFAGGGGSTYSGIAPVIVDNDNNTISVSAKEFIVNDPLQLVENPSAFELSLTANIDSPRTRIVEYGVDDWDTVESAISDMSAGKIDYVVAKMVEGNDIVYAPLARVNSGEQAIFVSPANAQDTSYGMGTRRVTDVISISSGGNWLDRMIKPFQGKLYGYGSVHVQATGSDYEISGDTLPTSALEAIDLVSTNSATWDTVSSKQPSGDYYSASNPSGFITGVPAGTMNESGFEYSGSTITGYNGSAFKAGDEFPQSATDAINVVTGNSANWNEVSSKLDTTAFSTVSGSFLTALPDSANWNSTYNTVSTNSGSWSGRPQIPISGINIDIYESAGKVVFSGMTGGGTDLDFGWHDTAISSINGSGLYDTSAHARITTLSNNKLNTTAFSTVSGDFLTAHQSLPESANWNAAYNEVSIKSADWNSAADMNVLPVSAGQGMDIQNVDGNIVFSCTGGSVPEGVLVESGLEYNAVNEISGYSGSAFAQYGAEKQWLQHDDTLVHAANSAQYALGVNLSAVAQLLGVDETVLWETTSNDATACTFSENWQNFEKIDVYAITNDNIGFVTTFPNYSRIGQVTLRCAFYSTAYGVYDKLATFNMTTGGMSSLKQCVARFGPGSAQYSFTTGDGIWLKKVIGIGRRNNT